MNNVKVIILSIVILSSHMSNNFPPIVFKSTTDLSIEHRAITHTTTDNCKVNLHETIICLSPNTAELIRCESPECTDEWRYNIWPDSQMEKILAIHKHKPAWAKPIYISKLSDLPTHTMWGLCQSVKKQSKYCDMSTCRSC